MKALEMEKSPMILETQAEIYESWGGAMKLSPIIAPRWPARQPCNPRKMDSYEWAWRRNATAALSNNNAKNSDWRHSDRNNADRIGG